MRYVLRISAAGRRDPAAGNMTWRAVAEIGSAYRRVTVSRGIPAVVFGECPAKEPVKRRAARMKMGVARAALPAAHFDRHATTPVTDLVR